MLSYHWYDSILSEVPTWCCITQVIMHEISKYCKTIFAGAGGEIGGGTAKQMAGWGAKLALIDIHEGRLNEVLAKCAEMGLPTHWWGSFSHYWSCNLACGTHKQGICPITYWWSELCFPVERGGHEAHQGHSHVHDGGPTVVPGRQPQDDLYDDASVSTLSGRK